MSSLARAFALFTGASVVGSLTQVAKGKLTATVLGTDGVGILHQLTNLWSLLSTLASLGLYNGMVRHLAPAWSEQDRMAFRRQMSTSAILLMLSGVITSLLGCYFSAILSDWIFDDRGIRSDLICLILLSIPLFVTAQIYRAMLNATRSVNALVRARIGADVMSLVVLVALIFPFGLKGAIVGYIALHLLYLILSIYFVRSILGADVATPTLKLFQEKEIQKNIGYGVNGILCVAVGILTTLIASRWIISSGGLGDNGLYSMAMKVATVYLGGLSSAAGGYYFPALCNVKNNQEMFKLINETLSMYMFAIPPIVLTLMLGGELMMRVLFTPEFIPAAFLLLLILPGDLFRISAETVGLSLLATKRLALSTGSYIVWALVYLGLVSILLPKYGLLGAACSYLLSHVFNAAQQLLLAYVVLGYRIDRSTLITLVIGIVAVGITAFLMFFNQSALLNCLIAAVMFAIWFIANWANPIFQKSVRKALRALPFSGLGRKYSK